MRSPAHAAVGGTAALPLVVGLWPAAAPRAAAAVWTYGLALSVLVDLDHFLVARLNTGDWRNAWRVLADPPIAVVGQDEIFDDGDVTELQRLLSHALLGGALVAGLLAVAPTLAVFTAVVLYVHVVADLLWDNWRA
jgi:hypothetical protein